MLRLLTRVDMNSMQCHTMHILILTRFKYEVCAHCNSEGEKIYSEMTVCHCLQNMCDVE